MNKLAIVINNATSHKKQQMAFLLANNSNKYNRRIEDTYIEDKMCTKNAKASEIVGGGEGAGIGFSFTSTTKNSY